jgi:phenylpropionate dioxygenase-like ring-hydroxylating dioxygenase large terminal subunit
VIGDGIRCPFHGWRYGANGRCAQIPYSERVPPGARVRAWPVQEVNGHICVWYAEDGRGPDFRIPEIAALSEARWSRPFRRTWTVRAALQDIFENGIDLGHFTGAHEFSRVGRFEFRCEGPTSITVYENHTRVAGREFCGRGESRADGAAYIASLTRSGMRDILFVLSGLPVDEHTVEVRGTARIRVTWNRPIDWALSKLIARRVFAEVEKDVVIWNQKLHLRRPLLVPGDGPILRYRRWFCQFYPARSEPIRTSSRRDIESRHGLA